jgi:hypothetical protein
LHNRRDNLLKVGKVDRGDDLHVHPLAVSRFGVMFFGDPAFGFGNMRTALAAGGAFASPAGVRSTKIRGSRFPCTPFMSM